MVRNALFDRTDSRSAHGNIVVVDALGLPNLSGLVKSADVQSIVAGSKVRLCDEGACSFAQSHGTVENSFAIRHYIGR
jgi:hypothetical protein